MLFPTHTLPTAPSLGKATLCLWVRDHLQQPLTPGHGLGTSLCQGLSQLFPPIPSLLRALFYIHTSLCSQRELLKLLVQGKQCWKCWDQPCSEDLRPELSQWKTQRLSGASKALLSGQAGTRLSFSPVRPHTCIQLPLYPLHQPFWGTAGPWCQPSKAPGQG